MKTLVHLLALLLVMGACEKKTLLRIKRAVVSEEIPAHTVRGEAPVTESAKTEAEAEKDVEKQVTKREETNETKEAPVPVRSTPKPTTPSTSDGKGIYESAVDAVKANDMATATKLYLEACEAGEMRGCHRYGYHQEKAKNFAAALEYYAKACQGGVGKACNNLGWTHEKKGEHAEAQNWYSWACLKSHPGSCGNLRRVEDKAKNKLAH